VEAGREAELIGFGGLAAQLIEAGGDEAVRAAGAGVVQEVRADMAAEAEHRDPLRQSFMTQGGLLSFSRIQDTCRMSLAGHIHRPSTSRANDDIEAPVVGVADEATMTAHKHMP
jgi:hypothetical protein